MASLQFLISATLLLLVLSPSSTADSILDLDGNPIINGGDYYILPHSSNSSGGLILKDSIIGLRACPLSITTAGPGEDGMSLKISTPYRLLNLFTSFPVEITFNSLIPLCGFTPLRWWVTPSDANENAYVVAGISGPFKPTYAFLIEGSDAGENVYNIKFCHLLLSKSESESESKLKSRSRSMFMSKRIKKVSDDDDEDKKECRDVTILEDGSLGVRKNATFPFVFKKKSSFPFLASNNM